MALLHRLPYHLGCPVWSSPHWRGSVYEARAPRKDWLAQYSQAFSTVEGNSTFYALPEPEVVKRWAAETADGFRFALKVPRSISHDRRLSDCRPETRAFLEILSILKAGGRLGPSFLQLPPTFDAREFGKLETWLKAWPRECPCAVEVRNDDYFDQGRVEHRLDELLRELEMDRVLFDSRPLYSAPPETESESVSQTRKPKSPFRTTVTARHPFVRLVGRDRVELVQPWIDEWAPIVSGWIQAGLNPYVFTHAPNDAFAPELAEAFHRAVSRSLPIVPPLPTGRAERNPGPSSSKHCSRFAPNRVRPD